MPDKWKRLYLRTGTPTLNPGTQPLSAALPAGTFNDMLLAPMTLLPWTGSSQTTIGNSSLPRNTHQDGFFTSFSSPPLLTATVPAGTWSFGIEAQEAGSNSNSFFAFSLYTYRPSGTTVATYIYDSDTPLASEWGVTPRGRGATFSGAGFTAQTGDLLVLEVWQHAIQGDSTSYLQQIFLDGDVDVTNADTNVDAASWIEAPQELGFSPRLRNVRVV